MKRLLLMIPLLLFVIGCGGPDELDTLRIGIIDTDPTEFQPVKEHMSKQLKMPVEIKVKSSYKSAIQSMQEGDIDLVYFGPFSYVVASEVADVMVVANSGKKEKSAIIANIASEIRIISDLEEESFAYVDTAFGNLLAKTMLKENSVNVGDTRFLKTYKQVEDAVSSNDITAGATIESSFTERINNGEIDDESVSILYYSQSVPSSPVAVRTNIMAEQRSSIQNALLGIEGYERASDSDFAYIRSAAETLSIDTTTLEALK